MGREKRIAESRTKDIMDKKGSDPRVDSARNKASGSVGDSIASPAMAVPQPAAKTGPVKAIIQIILLFVIPTLLILVIGKVIFKL